MISRSEPGVTFEFRDHRDEAVTPRRTDIAGFVGIAERGPLHQAVAVQSWNQFLSVFGGHLAQGYLAYAVEGFFANGGRRCWIARVADTATALVANTTVIDDRGRPALKIAAKNPGAWGNLVRGSIIRTGRNTFTLIVRDGRATQEIWRNLALSEQGIKALADSELIAAELSGENEAAAPRAGQFFLQGGSDGLSALTPDHLIGETGDLAGGLHSLSRIAEIDILGMPDAMPASRVAAQFKPVPPPDCNIVDPEAQVPRGDFAPQPVEYPPFWTEAEIARMQDALVQQSTILKNRIALLDSQIYDTTVEQVLARRHASAIDSSYCALYYPWVLVADPLALEGLVRAVPPCGHIAGVVARTDRRDGIHQPPANETLTAVQALADTLDSTRHGILNDNQINVIRRLNHSDIRVMGARTLSSDSRLRFLNVRRLLLFIAAAIEEAAQDYVFEPNSTVLWRDIDRVVRGFLDRLWRAGMLDGDTPEQAYRVRCDAETNPPHQTSEGKVLCEVEVYPPWPAEFITLRIGFTTAGVQIEEIR